MPAASAAGILPRNPLLGTLASSERHGDVFADLSGSGP